MAADRPRPSTPSASEIRPERTLWLLAIAHAVNHAQAVILPLIFLAVGQSTGLLLVTLPVALAIGAVVWAVALFLTARGASRFTRDRMASTI